MFCSEPPRIWNRTNLPQKESCRKQLTIQEMLWSGNPFKYFTNALSFINHVVLVNLLAQTDSQLLNQQL